MTNAIQVLEHQVGQCESMTSYFQEELSNLNYETADQSVKMELEMKAAENSALLVSCTNAIEKLKSLSQ